MSDYMLCGHPIGQVELENAHCNLCVDATIQERHEAIFKASIEELKQALVMDKDQIEDRIKELEQDLASHQEECDAYWENEKQQGNTSTRV